MDRYSLIYYFIHLVDYILNVQVSSEQMPKRLIQYPSILRIYR
jgi:hypothetical protein